MKKLPLFKVALMTATAEHLGVGVGEGLAQANPASEMYEDTRGFRLMAKGMALRMIKKGGRWQPREKAEDYLKIVMDNNTPVLNAAIAWGSAAENKVKQFLQGTNGKRARDSMTPRDVSLKQYFTKWGDPQLSGVGCGPGLSHVPRNPTRRGPG